MVQLDGVEPSTLRSRQATFKDVIILKNKSNEEGERKRERERGGLEFGNFFILVFFNTKVFI